MTGIRPGKVALFVDTNSLPNRKRLRTLRIERNGVMLPDGIEVGQREEVTGLAVVIGSGNGVLRGKVKIEGDPLEGIALYVCYRPLAGDPHACFHADALGRFVVERLIPGEYELTVGPMSVWVTGEAGSRTMSRMPTVKQVVNVTSEADSEVTLVLTLRPK